MIEDLLRWAHVIGASVLLGTGAGIAFFMIMAVRSRDTALIAGTGRIVVIADLVFTATAVLAQPVTGWLLARAVGWPLSEPWLVMAIGLYLFTGLCWLPVVWIQIRLRDMAAEAARDSAPLPAGFERLYRIWWGLGIPAFLSVLAIFWLMLARPEL